MHEEFVTFNELINGQWQPAEMYTDITLGWKAALERKSPHFSMVIFTHLYDLKIVSQVTYYLYRGTFFEDLEETFVWNYLEAEFSWEPKHE